MSSDSSANEDLLHRLKNGDEQALAELFSFYRDRLKRIVEFRMDRRLSGREDASDVLQEAYLDVRQRLRHYVDKPTCSFFLWIRLVTMQRLIDVHRRHLSAKMRDAKQEVPFFVGDLSETTSGSMARQIVAAVGSPSQIVMRAELTEQVENALATMDDIDREILALRHFEELTNNEIAEVLEITKAAASNRYIRALSRLREVLEGVPGFFGGAEPA